MSPKSIHGLSLPNSIVIHQGDRDWYGIRPLSLRGHVSLHWELNKYSKYNKFKEYGDIEGSD